MNNTSLDRHTYRKLRGCNYGPWNSTKFTHRAFIKVIGKYITDEPWYHYVEFSGTNPRELSDAVRAEVEFFRNNLKDLPPVPWAVELATWEVEGER